MTGTVGGENDGTATGLATQITNSEQIEILARLDELYKDDPSWPARRNAIVTALRYVGKIGYSQKHHGDSLSDGGLNDCSGYVSRCWYGVEFYSNEG